MLVIAQPPDDPEPYSFKQLSTIVDTFSAGGGPVRGRAADFPREWRRVLLLLLKIPRGT